MEKIKSIQPIIIVILICLSIFQFMQINKLRADVEYMESRISDIDSALDKRNSRSDIWHDIYDLKERVIRAEGTLEEQADDIVKLNRVILYKW